MPGSSHCSTADCERSSRPHSLSPPSHRVREIAFTTPANMTTITTTLETPSLTTTLVGKSSGINFLDLPTEVRLEIYHYLFDSSKISYETPHATYPPCRYTICTCSFPHQITRASRQIRYETLAMLLGTTTIEVAGSFDKFVNMPPPHRELVNTAVVLDAKLFSLRPFQLEYFPNLKILELRNITVWCKFYDEVYLESPAADEAMYGMALFNLQRTGRSLLALCEAIRCFAIRLCCQFVVNSLNDETIHAVIDVDERRIIRKSRGPPMKNFHSWSGFY